MHAPQRLIDDLDAALWVRDPDEVTPEPELPGHAWGPGPTQRHHGSVREARAQDEDPGVGPSSLRSLHHGSILAQPYGGLGGREGCAAQRSHSPKPLEVSDPVEQIFPACRLSKNGDSSLRAGVGSQFQAIAREVTHPKSLGQIRRLVLDMASLLEASLQQPQAFICHAATLEPGWGRS